MGRLRAWQHRRCRQRCSRVGSPANAIRTRRSKYWIQASLRTVWLWLEWSDWQLAFAGPKARFGSADGRYLLWSDIPNNRIMKWEEETGRVSVFRKPSNNANGNTRDRQGRLITCEHDTRRVTRTEYDGSITVLADRFEGKPLNSPNDVVVKSDSSVWFTDPPFGILGNYEGHVATPELPTNVYRIDAGTGQLSVITGEINRPNGLFLSRRNKALCDRSWSHTARGPLI